MPRTFFEPLPFTLEDFSSGRFLRGLDEATEFAARRAMEKMRTRHDEGLADLRRAFGCREIEIS